MLGRFAFGIVPLLGPVGLFWTGHYILGSLAALVFLILRLIVWGIREAVDENARTRIYEQAKGPDRLADSLSALTMYQNLARSLHHAGLGPAKVFSFLDPVVNEHWTDANMELLPGFVDLREFLKERPGATLESPDVQYLLRRIPLVVTDEDTRRVPMRAGLIYIAVLVVSLGFVIGAGIVWYAGW